MRIFNIRTLRKMLPRILEELPNSYERKEEGDEWQMSGCQIMLHLSVEKYILEFHPISLCLECEEVREFRDVRSETLRE